MANMFGALNRFISRLDSEQPQRSTGSGAYGFQILRNSNVDLPLEPWFDFIVGINGRTIESSEPSLFTAEVRNCAGSTISLGIYGAKGQQIREVYVPIPQDSAALGLSLQWSPLSSTEDVWHILDVEPNSPADIAGLLPYSDYVIGSPEGLVKGEHGFAELIDDYLDRPLRLHVYNSEYDVVRTLTLTPKRNWGGEGALGCVLAFGALHRLPAPLDEPTQAPGETIFDTSELLVPANLQLAPAPPPPMSKPNRKARAHHAVSPAAGIDDYFREGEEKSRELDRGSTPKNDSKSALPPPPRPKGHSPAATEP